MNLFITYLYQDPWFFLSWVFIIVFSICVHEYAHALTALKCGDDTAATAGHLSLNPLVQMGPWSLALLAVLGIAWGAVPVNPRRLRPYQAALVAFAGPASNLILCAAFAALHVLFLRVPLAATFFESASVANGVLFVLNMLPVPMLDGWAVFSLFVPLMERLDAQYAQQVSLVAVMLLFLTPLWDVIWVAGARVGHFLMNVFGIWV